MEQGLRLIRNQIASKIKQWIPTVTYAGWRPGFVWGNLWPSCAAGSQLLGASHIGEATWQENLQFAHPALQVHMRELVWVDLQDGLFWPWRLLRNASTYRNTFAMVLHALDPGHGSVLADGMGYSTWRDHSVVDLRRNSPHDHLHHDAIG